MCGLAGFIGESKNPCVTYKLTTQLFCKLKARGTDASGFWATNKNGDISWHKQPISSSKLVKLSQWKDLQNFYPNLILLHARKASFGDPSNNDNNHPFIGNDEKLSLIHNGNVSELLNNTYNTVSDCDSEVLLRIIEGYVSRIQGIKHIFSILKKGHMAVALAETTPSYRPTPTMQHLYLFRNKYRSLYLVDLTDELGQIFFCSSPKVWPISFSYINKSTSIPTGTIIHITLSNNILSFDKLHVKKGFFVNIKNFFSRMIGMSN